MATGLHAVRVPEALWAAVKVRAKDEGTTVDALMKRALREYVERPPAQGTSPTSDSFSPAVAAVMLHITPRALSALRRSGQIGYRLTGAGSVQPRVVYTQDDLDTYVTDTHRHVAGRRRGVRA